MVGEPNPEVADVWSRFGHLGNEPREERSSQRSRVDYGHLISVAVCLCNNVACCAIQPPRSLNCR